MSKCKFSKILLAILIWSIATIICARLFFHRHPLHDYRFLCVAISSPLIAFVIVYPHRLNIISPPFLSFAIWSLLQLVGGIILFGIAVRMGIQIKRYSLGGNIIPSVDETWETILWFLGIAAFTIGPWILFPAVLFTRAALLRDTKSPTMSDPYNSED